MQLISLKNVTSPKLNCHWTKLGCQDQSLKVQKLVLDTLD